MFIIPFNAANFQAIMKPRLSFAHLSLEYQNVESSVVLVCHNFAKILGQTTYDKVIMVEGAGLDLLQRTILHYAIYHHLIYTIANLSNDGITVTKSDDKTTIYKYQQDQLEEQLLRDAHAWQSMLIEWIEANPDLYPDWAQSTERQKMLDTPLTSDDFIRFVGVDDPAFMQYAAWIMREIWRGEVESRLRLLSEPTDEVLELARRATCYETMARAAERLAYHALPTPLRIDINNEMGKNHQQQADTYIKQTVAKQYHDMADTYFQSLDREIRRTTQDNAVADYQPTKQPREDQRFFV